MHIDSAILCYNRSFLLPVLVFSYVTNFLMYVVNNYIFVWRCYIVFIRIYNFLKVYEFVCFLCRLTVNTRATPIKLALLIKVKIVSINSMYQVMCVYLWWCTFRESYLLRVCFVWFNYGVIHNSSTISCDHFTYCKLATGRSLLILFAYHSMKRQFSMAYLLTVAVISQTESLLSAAELSIITTRYRPNTPPGGHMTTTVSAEPRAPSIRPH